VTNLCIDCGRAPATAGRRVCDNCLEAFVTDRMRRLGLPPGGRDPALTAAAVVRNFFRADRFFRAERVLG
jgi:hypothetical protein